MKISIFGLGYVGLTSAACALNDGHQVIGVDVNSIKVDALNLGECPIYEPGLPELLKQGVSSGKFKSFNIIGNHLATDDLAMVCVGTPSLPNGAHNMTYICEVISQIAASLAIGPERIKPLVIALRSTVRPGTMSTLVKPIFERILGENFNEIVHLVYNPEFLRESTAIEDYYNPPKIVIGTETGNGSDVMTQLYKDITAPIFETRFPEAEMTKFVDNTFHALKVAFANEIGRIAHGFDVSASKLHEIFISDTKLNISPYYFRPGGAFGGSCLPKDVRALISLSDEVGANTHVINSLLRSNGDHKRFLFESAVKNLPEGSSILLNGVAFKDNSDDLRESPLLDLADMCIRHGYKLKIHDPNVKTEQLIGSNLGYTMSLLPNLDDLMVTTSEAYDMNFDLVIDSRGNGADFSKISQVFDIQSLK
jgi:GDP-mannose 6-dehydrogenase